MPAGAIGLWWFDRFEANPRQCVPNALSSVAVSKSLVGAPRRLLNSSFWPSAAHGIVITDNYAATDTGEVEAAHFVGTGDGSFGWYYALSLNLPAGQYTIAGSARSTTGSAQNIRAGSNSVGMSTKSIGTTKTRYSVTFTSAGGGNEAIIFLRGGTASSNNDLEVYDLALYAGAVDLGEPQLDGHLYLGLDKYSGTSAVSNGEVAMNVAGSRIGLIQFQSDQVLTSWTASALLRRGSGAHVLHSFLSKVQDWTHFTAFESYGGVPGVAQQASSTSLFNLLTGLSASGAQVRSGIWDLSTQGYHLITHRYDATTQIYRLFVDDVPIFVWNGALSARHLSDLFFNTAVDFTLPGDLIYSAMALWPRALTSAEIRDWYRLARRRAVTNGQTVNGDTANRVIAFEGDSFENGFSYCWPYLYGPNASPVMMGTMFAVSGSTLADMTTRASQLDAVLPPNGKGRAFILAFAIGINDLKTYPGATHTAAATAYAAALQAYIDARLAAGWSKVAVGTVLPNSDAAHVARRPILNPLIRAMASTKVSVIDFAAEATMGLDATLANATYYDGTGHPTATGQALLEAVARPVLNGL